VAQHDQDIDVNSPTTYSPNFLRTDFSGESPKFRTPKDFAKNKIVRENPALSSDENDDEHDYREGFGKFVYVVGEGQVDTVCTYSYVRFVSDVVKMEKKLVRKQNPK
jgi:hypothetical protein